MKLSKREYLRERVYSYYTKYKHFGKKFTIDHFISEGESKSTIYNIINRSESGKPSKQNKEVVALPKFSIKRLRRNLSDWSITKMVYHKENSLVALNAHNNVLVK